MTDTFNESINKARFELTWVQWSRRGRRGRKTGETVSNGNGKKVYALLDER